MHNAAGRFATLETHDVIRFPFSMTVAGLVTVASLLTACKAIENTMGGDKIDYRTAKTNKAPQLEVPPDLTQLSVDPRYSPQAGVISASSLQGPNPAASATPADTVAPQAIGGVQLINQNGVRFVSTTIPPTQLWPILQQFWQERGLALVVDQADIGVMETDWAQNRVKLPNDIVRNTLGKVFDSLFSTGEIDKYRMRLERNAAGGSDIYIAHRGLQEVYTTPMKDATAWRPRPNEPLLEAELLSRLMVKLGNKEEAAKAAAAAQSASATSASVARARVVADRPASTLQVDESFDRAWRRVGLALDRSGFTVEDRDRTQGLYYVRYVDPGQAGKEEPGFFSRMFGKGDKLAGPARYRVNVKAEGDKSLVSVYDGKGAPENGEAGQRIVKLLLEDLR